MKRLLSVLAFLLLSSSAHADESMQLARMNPAVLGSGASSVDCTCTGTGELQAGAVERFEQGTGDFCTVIKTGLDWTTSGTTPDSYSSTQYQTCGHSLKATAANANTSTVAANIDDSDGFAVSFWFRIDGDITGYSTGSALGIILLYGTNTRFRVLNISDVYYFNFDGGTTSGSLAGITPSGNKWYRVLIDFNRNGTSTVYLYDSDGTTELTSGGYSRTSPDAAVTSLVIGIQYNNTGAERAVYLDNIEFDSNGL